MILMSKNIIRIVEDSCCNEVITRLLPENRVSDVEESRRSEADAEMPSTCILSSGQPGATPLVSTRRPVVCKLMRK